MSAAPWRIGVAGCGYWGPKLARNFNELAESQLAWVCDLNPDRLAHMRELYPGARTTQRYLDLVEADLDAVVIATPVRTHFEMAAAALAAGKHVLVEKPITFSSSEARDLIDLAARRGRVLMAGHTFQYNAAVETVRQLIASGELGEICYVDAARANLGLFQPDINVIWDLAPHDISILNYALGVEPIAVSARGSAYIRPASNLQEVAYVTLTYPNSIMANLRLSWLDPIKVRRIVVVGKAKMLVYDDIADDKVVIYDKGPELPPFSDTEQEFEMSYRDDGEIAVPVHWTEPLRVECRHFLECIRTGATPRSSGQDGLAIVLALEAAQRSLADGGRQAVVLGEA